jgi:NAD(P)H-hydrate epimerase
LKKDRIVTSDQALLTVSQMNAADRLAIAMGTPGVVLMESAGASVAHEITRRWSARAVAVLCGPGNNGGDGFVVARHLAAAGWAVRLALLGARDNLKGDAAHHAQLWAGPVEPLTLDVLDVLDGAALVVDALFGSGLTRALDGSVAEVLTAAALRAPIVSIDVPSGVMGDSGVTLGAVPAALTVTFFRKKPGHLLLPGRTLCGEVVVTQIGTPDAVLDQIAPQTFENDPALWRDVLPRPEQAGHKYTRGHALIWGGYPMTGAARMAARAAARAGAGLTTIAVPEQALPIYAAALTSIMVQPVATPQAFTDLLTDSRLSGFLIGPGAGISAATKTRALAMLGTGRAVVLDADALSVFQDGEFARLFAATGDKLERARTAAKRCGAVVVLKGADTVIAAPDGRAIVNANAPATLATAGSGDVLSGIILGLLTQGMDPFLAAAAAVWLHGAAAQSFGVGLIAEDLPDLLPPVLREIFEPRQARVQTP